MPHSTRSPSQRSQNTRSLPPPSLSPAPRSPRPTPAATLRDSLSGGLCSSTAGLIRCTASMDLQGRAVPSVDRLRVLLMLFHTMAQIMAEQEVENLSGLSTNPEKDIFVVRENGTTCLMAEFAAKFIVPYDVWASNYVDVRNLFPLSLLLGLQGEGHPSSRPFGNLGCPPSSPHPCRLLPNAAWGFQLAMPSAPLPALKVNPLLSASLSAGAARRASNCMFPEPGMRARKGAPKRATQSLDAPPFTAPAPGPGELRGRGASVFPADHRTG
ncbi:hypothetical protein H8959_022550 [Pygathrix nigripes]